MGATVSAEELNKYIVDNIDRAIRDGDIKIFYQPIIRTMTGKVCAAEALTRWIDPVHGFLSPGLFIKVLDDAGKLHVLDSHVIRGVCKDIRGKLDNGEEPFSVSINLTKSDFLNCDICKVFEESEKEYRIPAEYLCLEVSESTLKDNAEIENVLIMLLENGHERWLDDFGHGYSSFTALKRSYDVVKFDVRFLHGLGQNEVERARTIIAYSINMVKKLHFSTLIEGIETEEEYLFFKNLGCEMIQGYYFSRPMALEDLEDQGFEIESREERDYYNAIGQVTIEDSIGSDCFQEEAMAVFEYREDGISYLFQNEANKLFLAMVGGLDTQAAERIMNQKSGVLQERIRPFIKDLRSGGTNLKFSYLFCGKMINLKASFVAENPKTGAFAFAIWTTIMQDESRDTGSILLKSMQEVYTIFDRFDLIDYEEKTIKNTYINTTDYGGVTEGASIEKAIETWCNEVIIPEQRESFMEFMDIDGVKKKISKLRSKHLAHLFKTQMENGQYVEKEYILLPVNMGGKEMLLAGIINIDLGSSLL
ncbi:EAL domain-containing protein [Lachnospiraceae bacterium JC7]|nr:EAL domain-containing protein [Lachnospiraceae bacterium JC7]